MARGGALTPLELAALREEFPVTAHYTYLAHASVAPLSAAAVRAMRAHVDDVASHGAAHWRAWVRLEERTRESLARLLNADASEIAFVKNTSEGVNLVARGLGLRSGDAVLTVEGEFAANVTPWLALRDEGVRVRFAPSQAGVVRLDDVAAALAPDVRVLAISQVEYLSGFRNDLEHLGRMCRDRGVFLFVDAIQGLGAMPMDVKRFHVDALAADGHKWLCGPEGAGVLYVAQSALERVRVTHHGWHHLARRGRFADYYAPLRSDARRYEPGSLNHVGIAGLGATVDLLLSHGILAIEERVLALARRVAEGAAARGYQLLGSREPGECSGIVAFSKDGVDAMMLERQLQERRIITAPRDGFLRVAPHFYNTEDEVDQLLGALP